MPTLHKRSKSDATFTHFPGGQLTSHLLSGYPSQTKAPSLVDIRQGTLVLFLNQPENKKDKTEAEKRA